MAVLSARPARRLAVAVAALALLGACGGDSNDTSESTMAAQGTAGSSASPLTTATAPVPETSGAPGTTAAAATAESTAGSTAGSASTADIEAYVEEGAAEIGTDNADAATCFSRAVIDGIGADQILATGLSPEEFFASDSLEEAGVEITEEIQAEVQSNALECGDLVEIIAATIDDETNAECLRQTFTNELIAERFAVAVVGATPSPELEEAQALIQACGNP